MVSENTNRKNTPQTDLYGNCKTVFLYAVSTKIPLIYSLNYTFF